MDERETMAGEEGRRHDAAAPLPPEGLLTAQGETETGETPSGAEGGGREGSEEPATSLREAGSCTATPCGCWKSCRQDSTGKRRWP